MSPAKKQKTGGRQKGTPNKVTTETRALFKALVEELGPEIKEWIRRGAKKEPIEAANSVSRLAEFCIPKLARLQIDLKEISLEELAAELARREAAEAESDASPAGPPAVAG